MLGRSLQGTAVSGPIDFGLRKTLVIEDFSYGHTLFLLRKLGKTYFTDKPGRRLSAKMEQVFDKKGKTKKQGKSGAPTTHYLIADGNKGGERTEAVSAGQHHIFPQHFFQHFQKKISILFPENDWRFYL